MIKVCGEGNIGIGTDFTQDQDEAFFDWLRHDKGYARRMVPTRGTAPVITGLENLAQYPNLTQAMERRGLERDAHPWRPGRELASVFEGDLGCLRHSFASSESVSDTEKLQRPNLLCEQNLASFSGDEGVNGMCFSGTKRTSAGMLGDVRFQGQSGRRAMASATSAPDLKLTSGSDVPAPLGRHQRWASRAST